MTNKWEGRISINYVEFMNNHLKIGWSCEDCGFGELDIIVNKDKDNLLEDLVTSTKEYLIYTETLGQDFAKEVLKEVVNYIFDNSEIKE